MSLVDNVAGRLPVGGEFGGRNGDCAEYAIMIARAAVSPQHPTTDDELNRLTSEAIAANPPEAGPAGQMSDANAAWLCRVEGMKYTQIPYNRDGLYYWLSQGCAVCCGFSNGGALPGNEPGVKGHVVAVLAHDDTGFTLANGDSTNGRAGQLDTGVITAQIEAAQPTTLTVIEPDVSLNVAAILAAIQQIAAQVATLEQLVKAA